MIFGAGVLTGLSVLFPIWSIDLVAPQYPEGLALKIHADGIRGDVEIINGLNHYIGMKTLHDKDFIEFSLLPFILPAFALLFLITAILNKRRSLNWVFALFVLFGIVAIIDFWRWEYSYGHDLNPDAAIQVPGMAYQPPLIGFKQLLNFGAYSFPDTGGWLFIGTGILLLLTVILEYRLNRPKVLSPLAVPLLIAAVFSSCTHAVDPIRQGKDACHMCKMTFTDNRFGAAVLTKKGRTYKFDDIKCLQDMLDAHFIQKKEISKIYVIDFAGSQSLVPLEEATCIKSDSISGPMDGRIICFSDTKSAEEALRNFKGESVSRDDIAP